MNKEVTNQVKVLTPDGLEGQIESIDIMELGYVMVRVYIYNEKRWITYIMEDGLQQIISGAGLTLNDSVPILENI